MKLLKLKFGDLEGNLKSDLSNSCMVGLVIEHVFGFCKFGRVPRGGRGVDFLS